MIVPNEKEIKSILKNKNMILKSLRTKRCEIYRELMDKEDFMRAVLLHTPQMAQAKIKAPAIKTLWMKCKTMKNSPANMSRSCAHF